MASIHQGRCHCGAIGFRYQTGLCPNEWSVRACECSFCRAHGASYTSDPHGLVRLTAASQGALVRYSFALRTADFLICGQCGVLIATLASTPRGAFAAVNVNVFVEVPAALPPAIRVSYRLEGRVERLARRERTWTPVAEHHDLGARDPGSPGNKRRVGARGRREPGWPASST